MKSEIARDKTSDLTGEKRRRGGGNSSSELNIWSSASAV